MYLYILLCMCPCHLYYVYYLYMLENACALHTMKCTVIFKKVLTSFPGSTCINKDEIWLSFHKYHLKKPFSYSTHVFRVKHDFQVTWNTFHYRNLDGVLFTKFSACQVYLLANHLANRCQPSMIQIVLYKLDFFNITAQDWHLPQQLSSYNHWFSTINRC